MKLLGARQELWCGGLGAGRCELSPMCCVHTHARPIGQIRLAGEKEWKHMWAADKLGPCSSPSMISLWSGWAEGLRSPLVGFLIREMSRVMI